MTYHRLPDGLAQLGPQLTRVSTEIDRVISSLGNTDPNLIPLRQTLLDAKSQIEIAIFALEETLHIAQQNQWPFLQDPINYKFIYQEAEKILSDVKGMLEKLHESNIRPDHRTIRLMQRKVQQVQEMGAEIIGFVRLLRR